MGGLASARGAFGITSVRELGSLLRLVVRMEDPLAAARSLAEACQAAEAAGATSILLGQTDASARELAQEARALLARLRVPLLLSGRADVAIAVGAAGVHLGADDVPVPMIRRIAPGGFLIGASVATPQELENGRGADYWAIGPWRRDGAEAVGSAGFSALVRRAEGRPCIAIGGTLREDLDAVIGAGGVGIVVPEP